MVAMQSTFQRSLTVLEQLVMAQELSAQQGITARTAQ